MSNDKVVLELAIRKLTAELDSFISCCLDKDGSVITPQKGDVMRARACLPQGFDNCFEKKVRA